MLVWSRGKPQQSLQKEGYDITAEELVAFREKVTMLASQDGQLNVESLENISGVSVTLWRIVGAALLLAARRGW